MRSLARLDLKPPVWWLEAVVETLLQVAAARALKPRHLARAVWGLARFGLRPPEGARLKALLSSVFDGRREGRGNLGDGGGSRGQGFSASASGAGGGWDELRLEEVAALLNGLVAMGYVPPRMTLRAMLARIRSCAAEAGGLRPREVAGLLHSAAVLREGVRLRPGDGKYREQRQYRDQQPLPPAGGNRGGEGGAGVGGGASSQMDASQSAEGGEQRGTAMVGAAAFKADPPELPRPGDRYGGAATNCYDIWLRSNFLPDLVYAVLLWPEG